MNFFIGTIFERNANCQYTHVVRYTANDEHDAKQRLESIAATFYGNIGDADGYGYNFKRNEAYVWLSSGACKGISEETYRALTGIVIDQ